MYSVSQLARLSEKLEELMKTAEGPEALPGERKEMEELKALLPEIQEKVEDATEGLKLVKAAVGGDQVRWQLFFQNKRSKSVVFHVKMLNNFLFLPAGWRLPCKWRGFQFICKLLFIFFPFYFERTSLT